MLLLKLLISMVLAAIIEYVIRLLALRFFKWRFLRKAELISYLADSVLSFIYNNCNEDKNIQISVKYKHCKCKIKFHNSLEATSKIELLVYYAMKYYKIARYLDGREEITEKLEIDEAKEYLETICQEMREVIKNQEE